MTAGICNLTQKAEFLMEEFNYGLKIYRHWHKFNGKQFASRDRDKVAEESLEKGVGLIITTDMWSE